MKYNLKFDYGKLGLGDICFTIYLLENYGQQTNKIVYITGSKFIQSIQNLFDLKYVYYDNNDSQSITTKDILKFSECIKPNCCWPWITAFYHYAINDLDLNIKNLSLLKSKSHMRTIGSDIAVQLDGRTASRLNIKLRQTEIKNFIKKFTKKFYILGGLDTAKYLPNQMYCLGNLNYITEKILNCKFFVGSDSGISHLAGVMGVESKIIILQPCFNLIKNCYDLYPSTQSFSRKIFHIKNL